MIIKLHLVVAEVEPNVWNCACPLEPIISRAAPVHRDEIKEPRCKARVTKTKEVAASDIRFDIPLAEACYDDRHKYCDGVAPGSARVIRCLQDRFASWPFSTFVPIQPHLHPPQQQRLGCLTNPCSLWK